VAKTKSFNRAAEMTNTSQPTVSRQVKRLQDVVGSQLFISTPRGVKLTQKGEALAQALSRLDHTLYSITSDLKAETGEAEGTVRVSLTDGLNALFAAPALVQFSAQYPKIQLHLKSPLNHIDLRGKSNGHHDRICSERVIRYSIPKAGPTSFYSGRRERLYWDARVADDFQSGTTSFHSVRILFGENRPVDSWQQTVSRGRIAHYCDNSIAYGMLAKTGQGIGLLGSFTLIEPMPSAARNRREGFGSFFSAAA